MKAFLATMLGLIAIGVLLIAYGLLGPGASGAPLGTRANAARGDSDQLARMMPASERALLGSASNAPLGPQWQLRCEPGQRAVIRQVAGVATAECVSGADYNETYGANPASLIHRVSDVRQVEAQPYSAPRRAFRSRVQRSTGRDWRKTALIVGGSTATGAGLGAIFGGKKGALIGAAIGGGASTIYEATKH